MPIATLTEENVSTMQPVTHLFELSEPYEERVTHVLVTVATNPHNADEAVVMAATSGGAAMPEASQLRLWVLHRAENRTHAEALADLGYEVTDGAD